MLSQLQIVDWQMYQQTHDPDTLERLKSAETKFADIVKLLDQTFPGGRPTASGKHHKWDKLFLRVKPADKSKLLADYAALPKGHVAVD